MIEPEVIDLLIRVGIMENPFSEDALSLLTPLKEKGEISRLHWSKWDKVTEKMNVQDLVSLTKGLTVAEKYFHWIGGSVAGVIWVFRMLYGKDQEIAEKVGAWVKENTDNPYAP